MRSVYIINLTIVVLMYSPGVQSGEKPQWEFGVGVGGLSVPHYRGSDQRKDYIAPIPYVRYYGKRLKVDREGGRFSFYEGKVATLDISASFSFPVDSDDNDARRGMPDLNPVFEIGPRLRLNLYESNDRDFRFRVGIPLRLAIATDISSTANVGWILSPYLQLRYYNGWETAVSIGPLWASEKYHDYYYQVDQEYVTANRTAYNAKGGYSGSRITLTTSRRFNKIWCGLFMRFDRLNGAVFEDSPLVKQDNSLIVGIAVAWVFARSHNKVDALH